MGLTGVNDVILVALMCPDCPREPMLYMRVLGDHVFLNTPAPRTGTQNTRDDPAYVGPRDGSVNLGRRSPMEYEVETVGSRGAVRLACGRCHLARIVKRARIDSEARRAAKQGLRRMTIDDQGNFEPVIRVEDWRRAKAPKLP
jgi:hypothetical protein